MRQYLIFYLIYRSFFIQIVKSTIIAYELLDGIDGTKKKKINNYIIKTIIKDYE